MKAKFLLIALAAITFWGCDDNTDGLGIGMFPDNDQNIKGKLSTFDVKTQSVATGAIYAKTNVGYVGSFTDDLFGTYKAGFLAQLICVPELTLPKIYKETTVNGVKKGEGELVTSFDNIGFTNDDKAKYTLIEDANNNIIGNCQINIYLKYSSYFGDSLSTCRLSVYELGGDNKLTLNEDSAYYTTINPDSYFDRTTGFLGSKAYTAADQSVDDSIRNESGYVPNVSIRLDEARTKTLGQKLFVNSIAENKNFYKVFQDIFKGIYVESDFGDGTILYVDQVQMDVISVRYETDSITGVKIQKSNSSVDSIYYTRRSFYSTREVLQANQLMSDSIKMKEKIAETGWTYLKSPAGIFTEAELPITDIATQLPKDTLNAVKLTFTAYNQPTSNGIDMSTPSTVLLVRKKDQKSFFENNDVNDDITSYLASQSGNLYTFSNISKLITLCINEKAAAKTAAGASWDETAWIAANPDWNKVILIPVVVSTDTSNTTNSTTVIKIQHDLKPSYVRLKGGLGDTGTPGTDQVLKLEVISTDFGLK